MNMSQSQHQYFMGDRVGILWGSSLSRGLAVPSFHGSGVMADSTSGKESTGDMVGILRGNSLSCRLAVPSFHGSGVMVDSTSGQESTSWSPQPWDSHVGLKYFLISCILLTIF